MTQKTRLGRDTNPRMTPNCGATKSPHSTNRIDSTNRELDLVVKNASQRMLLDTMLPLMISKKGALRLRQRD